jgi:hypothetical protein
VKKIITNILLAAFIFQIGHSMAIGSMIHKIIFEISSYYSDETETNFFDFVFKDVTCETNQNESQNQKSLSNDLFCKDDEDEIICCDFGCEQKSYLTLSSLFPSGFYFALIQPPD